MHRVDVDAMLAEMPCRQYLEWKAFYGLDPWGDQRADMQNASLMWWIAITSCGEKNIDCKPEDLMLFPDGGPRKSAAGDQRGLMARIRSTAKRAGKVITG